MHFPGTARPSCGGVQTPGGGRCFAGRRPPKASLPIRSSYYAGGMNLATANTAP
jgi:hypothetical protein